MRSRVNSPLAPITPSSSTSITKGRSTPPSISRYAENSLFGISLRTRWQAVKLQLISSVKRLAFTSSRSPPFATMVLMAQVRSSNILTTIPNITTSVSTMQDRQLLKPVVLFDLLCNNADRKGSHVFFENGTHHLYAIDHGICFHEDDKLRTVLWDFSGQKIPTGLACLSFSKPQPAR